MRSHIIAALAVSLSLAGAAAPFEAAPSRLAASPAPPGAANPAPSPAPPSPAPPPPPPSPAPPPPPQTHVTPGQVLDALTEAHGALHGPGGISPDGVAKAQDLLGSLSTRLAADPTTFNRSVAQRVKAILMLIEDKCPTLQKTCA